MSVSHGDSHNLSPAEAAGRIRREYGLAIRPHIRELLNVVRSRDAEVTRQFDAGPVRGEVLAPNPGDLPGKSSWSVVIQQRRTAGAMRFTVAHELGHLLLREHDMNPRAEERWCNEFAAELLMPEDWVRKLYGDREPTADDMSDLQTRAGVSPSVALIQLKSVLNWDRALIGLKRRDGQWRVVSMVAVPKIAMYRLNPAEGLDQRMQAVAKAGTQWVPFTFEGEGIEILSLVRAQGAQRTLLIRASDLSRTCLEISHEKAQQAVTGPDTRRLESPSG